MNKNPQTITMCHVRDIRFPTSLKGDGSDAIHRDPDYSAVYVELKTDVEDLSGCGLSFTLGRGNEIVKCAVESLKFLIVGKNIRDIQTNMGKWVYDISNESQLRWIGPDKGVINLAFAAIVNAFWDLWGKMERKPVWKLLVDMSPEQIVSLINFKYLEDALSPREALNLLNKARNGSMDREKEIKVLGFPAYTTQVGWMNYSDEKIRSTAKAFIDRGFTAFKMKVGRDINDDKRRLRVIRECIGPDCKLMVDANQIWGVEQAIHWMKELAEFKITWIEEPTSPDDILGHITISEALRPYNIGVATGEVCHNRVMFKQFLSSGGMQFCQIDSARMVGLNDVLAVYLMAYKYGIPVCPHAGGVGLCEMVQHLQVFDYVSLGGTFEDRMIEYVDHLHEHFIYPPVIGESKYFPPTAPGYSTEMKRASIRDFEYPNGITWKNILCKTI
ncbi:mitochondrial enolase superfamily member 1 [Lepeophtheirus salmonis]|uniref:mitochondrial enolase superfamily member 1 n=1 Tax=Lepeophtheirus salmonis TaxID=72036 RepID=UPI001AE3C3C6|nr:mitochondrial enolase superfamily member 1-like [Lepeophtheirus salmonis]